MQHNYKYNTKNLGIKLLIGILNVHIKEHAFSNYEFLRLHGSISIFNNKYAESLSGLKLRASRRNRKIRHRSWSVSVASFALSAPLHRASLSSVLRAFLSFFPTISPSLVPLRIPRCLQTLLADETRFVLNFLDRAFRTIARDLFARLSQCGSRRIRLHFYIL